LFQDPSDPNVWVVQALERDIAASGPDIHRAKLAFERTVSGYITLAAKHQLEPLASLKAAPDVFWDIWDRIAGQAGASLEQMPSIPAYMIPVVSNDPIPAR
jgi:hypothetical protein